jgi:hypothetical protein
LIHIRIEMQRKRIPVLLDEYKALARQQNLPEPNSECKAGWCLQCQCPSNVIKDLFGDVEYIIEPQIPPISGSILPCISRRLVNTFDLTEIYNLASSINDASTCRAFRKEPVYARQFSTTEVGQLHKAKSISGVELKVTRITASDILVKQRLDLPNGVGEAVVDLATFKSRYVVTPTAMFSPYSDQYGIKAVELTYDFIEQLTPEDGPLYVKYNREVMTVIPGDIVTHAGVLIRKEMLGREFKIVADRDRQITNDENLQGLKL